MHRLTKPNSKYLDAKNHKLQQYENTGYTVFEFENLVESLRKDVRQSREHHEATKKLFRELESELKQYKRALELAGKTILSAFDDRCPVAFDNALGEYKDKCDSCEEEDAPKCWEEHFLAQAKAGDA